MKEVKPYIRKVHYYESDQMKIVHHSNYIKWFEEARIDFLEQIGITMPFIEEQGIMIPVLKVSCDYRVMTRFGDELLIGLKIEKYNGIKMLISYQIINTKTKEITNLGSSEHCFIDMEGNIVSLKKVHPQIHEMLAEYEGVATY